MFRLSSSLLAAAGFVGLFAATSPIPDFIAVTSATEVVGVTLDAEGEAAGEVLVTIEGLQEPLDSLDVELRVRVGGDEVPRWLELFEDGGWERRAKDAPFIGVPPFTCDPAPAPCEVVLPFQLRGRSDRTVELPFAAELGVLQWGDDPDEALLETLDGATVRLEVVLD